MDPELHNNFTFKVVSSKEEREKLTHITSYAFIPSPNDLDRSKKGFESIKDSYIQGVYPKNEETPIATATSDPMTQNIRGKIVKMGGIEAVATEPEYRKSGIVKQLMINILNHSKESGEVVSTLFPFKESFYTRFGYITLPQAKVATIKFHNLVQATILLLHGTVKHFYLNDVFDHFYKFLGEIQSLIHGFSLMSKSVTEYSAITNPSYVAFAYDEHDEIIGAFVYNTQGHSQNMDIQYFYYKNSNAKFLLLQFLAKHIDQFSELTIPCLPADPIELWLHDAKPKVFTRSWASNAMGRVVSVEGLNGIKVGSGSIIVEIRDEFCPWNEGKYHFTEHDGLLHIQKLAPTYDELDCELTIEGLSAIIYGGYNIEDFPIKKWIMNYSQDSLKKIMVLFPPVLPFMHEDF